jgi:hypothetical protein
MEEVGLVIAAEFGGELRGRVEEDMHVMPAGEEFAGDLELKDAGTTSRYGGQLTGDEPNAALLLLHSDEPPCFGAGRSLTR